MIGLVPTATERHNVILSGLSLLITCWAAAFAPSCTRTGERRSSGPTQADRLLQAYPEIQNGRLLIIADFEDEKQLALFRLEAGAVGALTRDLKKGRPETGPACLSATFHSTSDELVIGNTERGDWYLKRDWRPYDLLMMGVHSPFDGLMLDTTIVAGSGRQMTRAQTRSVLTSGWNVLRFDLAEAGERVPLDDIREIRVSVAQADQPVVLALDDILLAGNRKDLIGQSTAKDGSLYVQQAGRHWTIGGAGRFEISYINGQITHWYNLAADPYRLHNMVRGTALGPLPVALDAEDRIIDFPGLGGRVVSRQRIMEMSPVRVVVECEWRFADETRTAPEERPFQHWIYTIYPSGQMFIAVQAVTRTGEGAPFAVGLSAGMASSTEAPVLTQVSATTPGSNDASQKSLEAPLYASARSERSDSVLVFVPYDSGLRPRIEVMEDPGGRQTLLVWRRNDPIGDVTTWSCHLFLGSSSENDDAHVRARALNYVESGSVRFDVGTPQTGGALREDGFDPASGAYIVRTEQNRGRLVVQGKTRPVFSPAFEVLGPEIGDSWIYVKYLIHQPVHKKAPGRVLFQIPGVVRENILVEPLFQRRQGAS